MDRIRMHTTIKRAIFPVAGLGTRFLPATKANPKEMLPIVDKPLIQYAVEEAIAAGITELIFVTSSSKRAIEDHFDSNFELETTLAERGQRALLELVRNILPDGVSCAYVRQQAPRGLGHAVLCAKSLVMNEPFAVLLADDLIDGRGASCLQQMVNQFTTIAAPVVAVQRVKKSEVGKYGIIAGEPVTETHLTQLTGIVEKPLPQDAPSEWGVVGRYILTPAIFDYLESVPAAAQQEIQLTDAIAGLLSDTPVYAYAFRGKRYDCGTKLGYLEATMAYALQHPELAEPFKDMLSGLLVT
jgi:UTP--glucose-1-phosphate uridylyltransferase